MCRVSKCGKSAYIDWSNAEGDVEAENLSWHEDEEFMWPHEGSLPGEWKLKLQSERKDWNMVFNKGRETLDCCQRNWG